MDVVLRSSEVVSPNGGLPPFIRSWSFVWPSRFALTKVAPAKPQVSLPHSLATFTSGSTTIAHTPPLTKKSQRCLNVLSVSPYCLLDWKLIFNEGVLDSNDNELTWATLWNQSFDAFKRFDASHTKSTTTRNDFFFLNAEGKTVFRQQEAFLVPAWLATGSGSQATEAKGAVSLMLVAAGQPQWTTLGPDPNVSCAGV